MATRRDPRDTDAPFGHAGRADPLRADGAGPGPGPAQRLMATRVASTRGCSLSTIRLRTRTRPSMASRINHSPT